MALTFTPMVYGNLKNYFESGRYVVCKTKFGWLAYVNFGTKDQQLLNARDHSTPNTKAGVIAACEAHLAAAVAVAPVTTDWKKLAAKL